MPGGGHGDGLRIEGPVLIKKTNARERDFYMQASPKKLRELPQGLDETVFRAINQDCDGVDNDLYKPLRPYIPTFYGDYVIREEDKDARWIVLENLAHGLTDFRLMDIKIGAMSVSKSELIAGGRSTFSAWVKNRKLGVADEMTDSNDRGFRIVAASGTTGGRLKLSRLDPNQVYGTFFQDNSGPNALARRQEAADAVEAIRKSVNWSHFSMIAGSVLFVQGHNEKKTLETRTRLIDFAHSYGRNSFGNWDADKFRKYARNFSEGLAALSISLEPEPS